MDLKSRWDEFTTASAGSRFREHYDRVHKERRRSKWRRIVYCLLSLVLILIGAVLTLVPGPAMLCFLIAAILLSSESRTLASVLDAAEIKVRAGVARFKR